MIASGGNYGIWLDHDPPVRHDRWTQNQGQQLQPTAGDLARRARGGDAGAFEELIRRHERLALSVGYSILGDAAEAGDVAQEAFLRAWQRLADLKDPDRFAPWISNIVRNLALDVRRRSRPLSLANYAEADAATPLVHNTANPHDALQGAEDRMRVNEALQSLDETTRTAVVLRYYEGLSSKEIAQALDLNPAAVDMRLSRGRKQLKEILSPAQAVAGNETA